MKRIILVAILIGFGLREVGPDAARAESRLSAKDALILKWGRAQIQGAQVLSQKCAADLGMTGQPAILTPAVIARDPSFEEQRAALRQASSVLGKCKVMFDEVLLPKARRDLETSGLSAPDQAMAFDKFKHGFAAASASDLASLQEFLDAEDDLLVHLQSTRATFDQASGAFLFANPSDIEKFDAKFARVQELARKMQADAKAHQETAGSF